ncbi:MAG TPA: WbqC family protein [Dermatophilaceae bacterium]|nr:WbqC family protein [Dermatophilaceae bacterium]
MTGQNAGRGRLVTIHQPDLLPYSGFWHKMALADVFVVAEHDQFQKHGYQRRVTMRGSWVSHVLVGKPSLVPITSVQVAPGWQGRLADAIRGRYAAARHWRSRGTDLLERLAGCSGETLAEVNTSMIVMIRDVLGIDTPLAWTAPPVGAGLERLVEQVHAVGGTAYLSGSGGAAYLGPDAADRFAAAGIELRWSDHAMTTGDSIVQVLLDEDDPMEIVLRRP